MIETSSLISFCIAAAIVLIVARIVFKSRTSFFGIIINVAMGVFALWLLDTIGYGVPINWITAGLVGLLGVPGVILVVILKYVIHLI